MKIGKKVLDRTNQSLFTYNNTVYKYDTLYKLIKDIKYRSSDECNWQVINAISNDNQPCLVILFQETVTKKDWLYDFKFWSTSKAYDGWDNKLKFHTGFYQQYQMCRDELSVEVDNFIKQYGYGKIIVCGWSLGGSIAPICCEDIFYKTNIKPTLITYEGANPCCTKHTRDYIYKVIANDSICFVNDVDAVPRVLPIWKLSDYIYYMKKDYKFPILINKLISTIKNTEYLHCNVDSAINEFME